MRATKSQRLLLREKRHPRKKKRLEEHARHRAAMAGTIGVATSVLHACIPESLIEAEVAAV